MLLGNRKTHSYTVAEFYGLTYVVNKPDNAESCIPSYGVIAEFCGLTCSKNKPDSLERQALHATADSLERQALINSGD